MKNYYHSFFEIIKYHKASVELKQESYRKNMAAPIHIKSMKKLTMDTDAHVGCQEV